MVTEAYVVQACGVARPTARTAIDRLVADGLLVREPHAAARVRRLGSDDFSDLFFARAAVEAAAVELLAHSGSIPPAAEAAHARLRALDPGEPYASIDIDFHRALVGGAPTVRLPKLHHLLMGEIELGITQIDAHGLRSIAEICAEHQGILDAVTDGDGERASRLSRVHVLASRERLAEHFDLRQHES